MKTNKTWKQVLSFALMVAIAVSLLVPAVSAESNDKNYSFFVEYNSGKTKVDNLYDLVVSYDGWEYIARSSGAFRPRLNTTTGLFMTSSDAGGDWMAIRIETKGYTEVTFSRGGNSNGGKYNFYLLSGDTVDAAYTGAADAARIQSTISEALSDPIAIIENVDGASMKTEPIPVFTNLDPNAESYIVVVKSLEASKMAVLQGFTLSGAPTASEPVATVGDTNYTDAAEAIAAIAVADENTKVEITGNLQLSDDLSTAAAITVKDGAELDLNGRTLTANVTGSGTVTDSSTGSTGKIVGKSAVQKVGAGEMALYDGETTRIVTCTVSALEAEEVTAEGAVSAVKFWYTITFDNEDVYQMIEDASDDAQFTIGAELTFGGTTKNAELKNTTVVSDWAGAMADRKEGDVYAFYVSVTGFENLASGTTGELSVKLWTKDATNTQAYSNAVVYNIGG